jgi:hypothetical protein
LSEATHWQANGYDWYYLVSGDVRGFVAKSVFAIELPAPTYTDSERALIVAWRNHDWGSALVLFDNPLLFQLSFVERGLIEMYRTGTTFDVIRWLLDLLEDENEQGD